MNDSGLNTKIRAQDIVATNTPHYKMTVNTLPKLMSITN